MSSGDSIYSQEIRFKTWKCIRSSSDEDILVSSGRPFRFVWETWMEMVSSDDEETWKSSSDEGYMYRAQDMYELISVS